MADFPELIIFALVCAAIATLAVLGGVAFRRTSKLRAALALAEQRIRFLEETLHDLMTTGAGAVAPSELAPAPPVFTPPPLAEPAAAPRKPVLARIEKSLASNWLVWIGGAFIALAIIFILRIAIDSGWFGPPSQLAAAYLLGAALLGAAEYLRRRSPRDVSTQIRHLPAILAAAGLFAIFMATYAGHATLHLLTTGLTFVVLALCALGAIMLALRYGPWLAALGLGGGYLAPALVKFADPSPTALFGYILALSAATLAIIKLRRWRGFVWLVAGGALAWGAAWLISAAPDGPFGAAAFYMVALAALGVTFAWNETPAVPAFSEWRRLLQVWGEPTLAAHALIAAAGIILLLMAAASTSVFVSAALVAFCAMTAIVASAREGFSLAPLGAALCGVGAIYFWRAAGPLASLNVSALMFTAGALGFVFSGGGWLMMARSHRPGFGAALAALGPIAVVAATHETAPFLRTSWTFAAVILGGLNGFAAHQLARGRSVDERGRGAIAAFILGAATCASFAVYFLLENAGLWLSAALAVLIPACAYFDHRLKAPSLRIAVSVLTAIVTWRLVLGLEPLRFQVSVTPLLNELFPGYALSALCLWCAGWLYRHTEFWPNARLVQMLEAAALVVAVTGLSWEARHVATGGTLRAPAVPLLEAGLHATAWLALALGLAARFGAKPRAVLFFAETILAAAGALLAVLGCGLALNPWWGAGGRMPGWPILNPLFVAYGAPAVLLAAYAILKRRQGLVLRGALAGAAATLLAFLNVTLEVRRLFQGPDMATGGAIGPVEAWAYTAVWVGFAGVLLALGLMRRKPSLRYASLVVLLAAIIKAFGFDMGALTGVLRAFSYLGLGISVIAVALIYQRYVFPRQDMSAS